MASTGMFGSNIGGKASQRPKPRRTAPAGILKLVEPHITGGTSFHIPSSDTVPQSLIGGSAHTPDTNWNQGATHQALPGSGGSDNPLSGLLGGVEGFIGHLGSDIVHTAYGLPVGIAYMFEHPIAGVEGAAKATWNDWSPLFHGDVRTWLHNTYEHPLAPILDVFSVVTLGGALAGKTAAVVGRVGEASMAADELAATSAATVAGARASIGGTRALGVGTGITAHAAGEIAGAASAGMATSATFERMLKFANPTAYAGRTYGKLADTLGWTGEARDEFIAAALNKDPLARRVLVSKGGVAGKYADMSTNPVLRARQAGLQKLGNKVAATSPTKLGKLIGDDAAYKRWRHIDAGSRRAAVAVAIQRQLAELHHLGKAITGMTHVEVIEHMEPSMRSAVIAHSHEIVRQGLPGSKEEAAQIAQLGKEGIHLVAHDGYRDPAMAKAYANVAKASAKGEEFGNQAVEDFFKEHWAKANVTNDARSALTDANGNWRGVSAHKEGGVEAHTGEAFFSHGVVKLIYTNPTKVWKYLLLGASPRYFINNFVGNSLMLMAATDPVSLSKAFFDHVRTVHGAKAEQALLEESIRTMGAAAGQTAHQIAGDVAKSRATFTLSGGGHWMGKWFGGEYGWGNSNRMDEFGRPDNSRLGNLPSLHRVTHERADMPQRYMAMNYTMRRIPEYQQAYARLRAGGADHLKASREAADIAARNPAVRQLIRGQVNHMFGQYHSFYGWEHTIQRAVPFYSWTRAISTHMKYLVTQQTYKVAMGAAIGTLGNLKTQEIMGQVPDFMLGAIPAKLLTGPLSPLASLMGQAPNSRVNVFTTAGLNPYASIGDVSHMGLAALGIGHFRTGEALGSTLNPLIQGAAQQLAGTNLATGTPMKPSAGGPIIGMYTSMFEGLPQMSLLKGLLGMEGDSTTSKGNPTLYAKTLQASFSSYAGFPIRQVDVGTANSLADLTNGTKKKKNPPVPGF
jgi:hypothetical protein